MWPCWYKLMGTLVAKRPRTVKLAGVYARPKPTAPTARLLFFPKKASDLRRRFFHGTARQFCRERDGGKTSRPQQTQASPGGVSTTLRSRRPGPPGHHSLPSLGPLPVGQLRPNGGDFCRTVA